MSAAAIGFGADLEIQKLGSVPLDDSGSCVDTHRSKAAATRTSMEPNDFGFYGEVASEVDLLSAATNGDQRAFTELCRRYMPSLKRRISHIVRNREDAEDVLQDTLISAFLHLAGFRTQCKFQTWLMTIATNTSLMLLRKRRNRPEAAFGAITADGVPVETLEFSDPMPNPEQLHMERQESHKVSRAVEMLRPAFRMMVERYYRDELKLVDAANAMGITEAAAKSRLVRARKVLRRHLKSAVIRSVR